MDSPGILKTLLAYLYWEYSDDDALQAFIASENELSQAMLDWFNTIDLPVYTSPTIGGPLLDWVGAGLYGLPRPVIHCAVAPKFLGAFGTIFFGYRLAFGQISRVGPTVYYATTDDIYKRILTWHFFKGDGKVFTEHWLKRRVMRFLIGVNGTAPRIDWCGQISIRTGGGQATIMILQYLLIPYSGSIFGTRGCAFGTATAFGTVKSKTKILGSPFAEAIVFKAAVDAGVLELPFQYRWSVFIGPAPPTTAIFEPPGVHYLTDDQGNVLHDDSGNPIIRG
jgi:hypothetical protein